MNNSFQTSILCVFHTLFALVGLYANGNLHIHEQISDVTVGSDATSWLICAHGSLNVICCLIINRVFSLARFGVLILCT